MSSPTEPMTEVQVRKVAALAKLAPDDAEVQRLRVELGAILGYAQSLAALDLSAVEPLVSPLEMTGPMADDRPAGELPRITLEQMAPAMDGPLIKVPKVLGDGGGGGA